MDVHKPATHLDHLIRQTRDHHVQLSAMADMKANMILTVASLLIPLSIQYLANPMFRLSAMIMVGACVITVIISAYAAMPKVQSHPKQSAVGPRIGNPLFFGAFSALSYTEYIATMETILNDHNRAYEVQLREIYEMGAYLAFKKYRYVRLAYGVFIVGVVASTLAHLFRAIAS